ncbi:acyl-protein thioesterase [Hypoxylon rubiginosum]|uniref:Acyl-protein thioesterase n=1 Tax=Hypoxylon rubiginosum TaxID=110542 RepID=A0ACC0DKB8_9PEZI|nr:acyl-protein thioesterase [Hypoxylon rubiginosum]
MSSEKLDLLSRHSLFIVEPTSQHTHTFIFLHDLGSNGEEFSHQLLETGTCSDGRKLPEVFQGARFIFPTAKSRRSSAYGQAKLTQWFDIASLDDPWHQSQTQLMGLVESTREILKLVNEEVQVLKIPRSNIIIGGHGHGCAMALFCLLALDFPLGAFIGMSGWLPFQPDIEQLLNYEDEIDKFTDYPFSFFRSTHDEEPRDPAIDVVEYSRDLVCFPNPIKDATSIATPIFLGHSDLDEKVKHSFGENASTTLSSIGYNVTWKSYRNQGHWYKMPDEIDDIVDFMQHRVDKGSGNT